MLVSFGALGVSSAILSMTLVAGGSLVVASFQWLQDKVQRDKEQRLWNSVAHNRTYQNGERVLVKKQAGDYGQSVTPPRGIRGKAGVIHILHSWVGTQGQNHGTYAVYIGNETHLIDENWLEAHP